MAKFTRQDQRRLDREWESREEKLEILTDGISRVESAGKVGTALLIATAETISLWGQDALSRDLFENDTRWQKQYHTLMVAYWSAIQRI